MPKGRSNSVILIWTILASLFGTLAQAQEDSTGNWRIRHHEPLRAMYVETLRAESNDSEGVASNGIQRLSFEAFSRDFELNLESNDRLIADLGEDQRRAMGSDLRLYRGSVVGVEDSWLRLTHSSGRWSGMIWDGVELYIIDPVDTVARAVDTRVEADVGGNIIYRLSDTEDLTPVHCGLDSAVNGAGGPTDEFRALSQFLDAAQPLAAMALSEEALELVVVADAEFVAENGVNTALAVTSRINVVDGIFDSQVGVALSLVEIVEFTSNGSLSATDAHQLLDQFANLSVSGEIDNPGLAHLFTGRILDGSTVGTARQPGICRLESGVGLSKTSGSGTRGALIVAHEIGHNFGAPHDNENGSPCAATPSGFLMNPSLNFGGDTFSECSLDAIAPIVEQAQCLVTVPEPGWVASLVVLPLLFALRVRGQKRQISRP